MFKTTIILAWVTLTGSGCLAQSLNYQLNERGLQSLTYNGFEFIKDPTYQGEFGLYGIAPQLKRKDNSTYSVSKEPTTNLKPTAGRPIVRGYQWGTATCQYAKQGKSRLDITVTVRNTTADVISYVPVNLLVPDFPVIPQGITPSGGPIPLHQQPLWADPMEHPGVVLINYGKGVLALCNDEDPKRKCRVGIPFRFNSNERYLIAFQSSEPIPAGRSATYHLSLRFGPAGSTALDLASDIYQNFAKAFPYQVRWKDHRIIGSAFLTTTVPHPLKNPRGWFNNDPMVDVTTEAGKADFRKRLLAYADACLVNLKDLNAQGIITWDIEGEEFGAINYVGDPAMIGTLAPEMEWKGANGRTTVDEYFGKFKNAGFKVGICLRPTRVTATGQGYEQKQTNNPAQVLIDKISYAKRRWGCRMFYIDSNVNPTAYPYWIMDATVFKRVADAHPDVLLMPEWQTPKYYAYTIPYEEVDMNGISTPPAVRQLYPKAFSVINVAEGDIDGQRTGLLRAVKQGDIMLCQVWWTPSSTTFTKKIYSEAEGKQSKK